MELLDLPEEIIVAIIQYLDVQSLRHLYNTNSQLRSIIQLKGTVKRWNMSMSVNATINTFKLRMFKDVSSHLQVLNLSGVPDLYTSVLIPVLKELKYLKCLDVSYTNVCILDLFSIPQICPTLNDIAVNLTLKHKTGLSSSMSIFSLDVMEQCQNLLKQFKNIHLIGPLDYLLNTSFAFFLLKYACLQILKFSIVEFDYSTMLVEPIYYRYTPQFSEFFIYLMNWEEIGEIVTSYRREYDVQPWHVMSMLEFEKNNNVGIAIVTNGLCTHTIYASLLFNDFFTQHFNVKVECITSFKKYTKNTAIMVWNQETTKFDDKFFNKLAINLRKYFPQDVKMPSTKDNDWFFSVPTARDVTKTSHESHNGNNLPLKFKLDYDSIFRERQNIELSVVLDENFARTITISPDSDYLKKLTYFSLSDIGYSSTHFGYEFFRDLFICCENLVTLNVQHCSFTPMSSDYVADHIPCSKSLKNIRILDYNICFDALFTAFSRCRTLENIYLISYRGERCPDIDLNWGDPTEMIKICDNLYNIFIKGPMVRETRIDVWEMFNAAKNMYRRPYLNVVLHDLEPNNWYDYDPFIEVFKVRTIRPTF